jgi:hypothetical protein
VLPCRFIASINHWLQRQQTPEKGVNQALILERVYRGVKPLPHGKNKSAGLVGPAQ